jgi:hypothetical protein
VIAKLSGSVVGEPTIEQIPTWLMSCRGPRYCASKEDADCMSAPSVLLLERYIDHVVCQQRGEELFRPLRAFAVANDIDATTFNV